MKRKRVGLAAAFLFLLWLLSTSVAQAREPTLVIDLADTHVDITSGFTGSRVVLFGFKDAPGDIAVAINGPIKEAVVRRKERVLGLWVNRKSFVFHSVPVYYDYALSRPESALASPDLLRAHAIGLDALMFEPALTTDPQGIARAHEGLIRDRQSRGLYPLEPRPIEFPDEHLFRATFNLPANVPTGEYTIRAFLIQNGQVVKEAGTTLTVAQVGFSARVFNFAWAHGLVYGLCSVLLAVGAGWSAHAFLRRD